MAKLHTISGVEIFAAGFYKEKGTYSIQDLDAMVAAYDEVGFIPPLKEGHEKDRPGLPALGWVHNLRRIGKKLVADFEDVHEAVFNAIKNRRFDRVSSEIFFNFMNGGKKFPKVLKAVSLLGAEIPAVRELKPLREQFEGDFEWAFFDSDPEPIKEEEEKKEFAFHNFTGRLPEQVYIDKLPDEAFGLILPGFTKDSEGRTQPPSARLFPHHDIDVKDTAELETVNYALLNQSFDGIFESQELTTKQLALVMEHFRFHYEQMKEETKSERVSLSEDFQEGEKGKIKLIMGKLKGQEKESVQSLVFSKKHFSVAQAKTWAVSNGLQTQKINETVNVIRLKQKDPNDYQSKSFRTILLIEEEFKLDSLQNLEDTMDLDKKIEKLEASIVKLSTSLEDKEKDKLSDEQVAQFSEQKKTLEEGLTELKEFKTELAEKEKKFSEISDVNLKLQSDIRMKEVSGKVEKVKLPALRKYFKAFYEASGSLEETVQFSIEGEDKKEKKVSLEEAIDEFSSALNKLAETKVFGEITTEPEVKRDERATNEDPALEVDTKVREFMAANKEADYEVAFSEVLRADPKLKEAYAASA